MSWRYKSYCSRQIFIGNQERSEECFFLDSLLEDLISVDILLNDRCKGFHSVFWRNTEDVVNFPKIIKNFATTVVADSGILRIMQVGFMFILRNGTRTIRIMGRIIRKT